jgi:hypothetical protein
MRVYPKDYNLSNFKNLHQVGQKDFGIQSLALQLLRGWANVKRKNFNNGGGDATLKKELNFQTSGIYRFFLKKEDPNQDARATQTAGVTMTLKGVWCIEMSVRYWDEPEKTKLFLDIGISRTKPKIVLNCPAVDCKHNLNGVLLLFCEIYSTFVIKKSAEKSAKTLFQKLNHHPFDWTSTAFTTELLLRCCNMRLNKNFNRFVYGRNRIKERHKNGKKTKRRRKSYALVKFRDVLPRYSEA